MFLRQNLEEKVSFCERMLYCTDIYEYIDNRLHLGMHLKVGFSTLVFSTALSVASSALVYGADIIVSSANRSAPMSQFVPFVEVIKACVIGMPIISATGYFILSCAYPNDSAGDRFTKTSVVAMLTTSVAPILGARLSQMIAAYYYSIEVSILTVGATAAVIICPTLVYQYVGNQQVQLPPPVNEQEPPPPPPPRMHPYDRIFELVSNNSIRTAFLVADNAVVRGEDRAYLVLAEALIPVDINKALEALKLIAPDNPLYGEAKWKEGNIWYTHMSQESLDNEELKKAYKAFFIAAEKRFDGAANMAGITWNQIKGNGHFEPERLIEKIDPHDPLEMSKCMLTMAEHMKKIEEENRELRHTNRQLQGLPSLSDGNVDLERQAGIRDAPAPSESSYSRWNPWRYFR